MIDSFRILITGSRNWTDRAKIVKELNRYYLVYENITLVSGHCHTGADQLCEEYARLAGWPIERHPADWDTYGKKAGYLRNKEMVDLGANVCLAFIKDNSKGASMTARLARKAGIETQIFSS